MSLLIDLMPGSCKVRVRSRRTARRWWGAYALVVGAVALATVGLRVRSITDRRVRDALLQEVALDQDYDRQLEELRIRSGAVRDTIVRHEQLAWPVPLPDVIGALSEVVPEAVALTSITVTPKLEPERVGKPSGPPPALALTLEATGVAPTDLDVATLIAGLEDRGLFARVAMDHARETTVRGGRAREFGLTCEIDLASRRRKGAFPATEAAGAAK